MRKLISVVALSVALFLASAPAVLAADAAKFPPAVVAVVDVQKIMRESSAAKSVRDQLATKRTEYQKMVNGDEQKLREEEQKLATEKSKLTAEEFAKKREAFAGKVKATQEEVQGRARVLDNAFNGALEEIKKALGQVVADAANAHGASVVMDRGQLLIVESSLDMTDEVLVAINKALPSVTVKVPDASAKKK
jgi:outer membrane protein